jgi:hypothetical protein
MTDYAAARRAKCNAIEATSYAPAIGASLIACLPPAASALSLALLGEAPTGDAKVIPLPVRGTSDGAA